MKKIQTLLSIFLALFIANSTLAQKDGKKAEQLLKHLRLLYGADQF